MQQQRPQSISTLNEHQIPGNGLRRPMSFWPWAVNVTSGQGGQCHNTSTSRSLQSSVHCQTFLWTVLNLSCFFISEAAIHSQESICLTNIWRALANPLLSWTCSTLLSCSFTEITNLPGNSLRTDLVWVVFIKKFSQTPHCRLYSGDMKSGNIWNPDFLKGWISNGPVFKWLGYSYSPNHLKTRPFQICTFPLVQNSNG